MGNLFAKKKKYDLVGVNEELVAEEEQQKKKKSESHLRTVKTLLPYLWPKGEIFVRFCVIVALTLMFFAKLCNVTVPIAYKHAVDILNSDEVKIIDTNLYNNTNAGVPAPSDDGSEVSAFDKLVYPVGWIMLYGILKYFSSFLGDLRDTVFVNVTQHALRTTAIKTFEHLHQLSLRFHLQRQTGGVLRAIERGTEGISFILTFVLFNIAPTLLEIIFVCIILAYLYPIWFAIITLTTMVIYITLTLSITQWRIKFRREMNEMNNTANNKAVDSLINFETVKYFSNEDHEANRYGESMKAYNKASIKSQSSLTLLNGAQALIIATGLTSVMLLAAYYVYDNGRMTVGDFVLVNTYMIQLAIPLNFLGTSYRMIKSALVDLENMFTLLDEELDVKDKPNADDIHVRGGKISFRDVSFSYKDGMPIFSNISFEVKEGNMLAIVGPTGAGKSTISRLLFRFYDVKSGSIEIDGQDIRDVTQKSLRKSIGIVPQDTVLFNDTIEYNIRYGNLSASEFDVQNAAKLAQIHDFITTQPDGYKTLVGERGLRLSGGEKQRIAIARAILKDPPIMLFDEATSALDSTTERLIQSQLKDVSKGRTTLVIAHRLSTIVDADEIIVLKNGTIAERGNHQQLLELQGEYCTMWRRQQESQEEIQNDLFKLE